MTILRDKDLQNDENELPRFQKLSQLLPTFIGHDKEVYLRAVRPDEFFECSPEAAFKSIDIADGWKHMAKRYWYHPLHQVAPYLGRFPPALARYFITKFSKEDQVVYDPFSGSGTVPLEACLLNRDAKGNDIFVYAYTLSHAKAQPLQKQEFDAFLQLLRSEVDAKIEQVDINGEQVLRDLQVYYHPDTLRQLLAARLVLNEAEHFEQQTRATLFVKAMICGILHGDSAMYLSVQTKDTWSASVKYVREYVAKHNLQYEARDLFDCLEKKAKAWFKMSVNQSDN